MPSPLIFTEAARAMDSWRTSEPVTSARGGRSVYFLSGAEGRPRIQLCREGTHLRLVQNPGSTLVYRVDDPNLVDFCAVLDGFVQRTALRKCEEWFKKRLTAEELGSLYRPFLASEPGRDGWLLRSRAAPNLKVWRSTSRSTYGESSLSELSGATRLWACVEVSGIYFLPRAFGLTLTTTDILAWPDENVETFPFIMSPAPKYVPDASDQDDDADPTTHPFAVEV